MRRALSLATFAVVVAWASSAGAVGWSVSIESPGPIAAGVVTVRARASGGVGQPTGAAYHVRSSGGWSQGSAVGMAGSGSVWSESWTTAGLPNGSYQLEVRMWGDVPPYAPGDPASYASRTVVVAVENAPPAPTGLSVALVAGEHRLSWTPLASAARPDFRGYRVWRSRGPGCGSGLGGYAQVAGTDEPTYRTPAETGPWCYVVTAERSAPTSGSLASPPSPPASVDAPAVAGTAPGSTPGEVPVRPATTDEGGSAEEIPDEGASPVAPAPAPTPPARAVDPEPDGVAASPAPTTAADVAAAIGGTAQAGSSTGPSGFGAAATIAVGMILVVLSLQLRVLLARGRFR